MFKVGERYKITNPNLDEYGMMFTIVKIENKYIYYVFDGDKSVFAFKRGGFFETSITKIS